MFFHLLNDQILAVYGIPQRLGGKLVSECRLNLRLAVIAQERIQIPTVDLRQSPVAAALREDLSSLAEVGIITFTGSTADLEELMDRKRAHYEGTGVHTEWTEASVRAELQPYAPYLERRAINTTREMKALWANSVEHLDEGTSFLVQTLRRIMLNAPRRSKMMKRLLAVPEDLAGHAFLTIVLTKLRIIPELANDITLVSDMDMALANAWLAAHLREYGPEYLARGTRAIGRLDCGLLPDKQGVPVDLSVYEREMIRANVLQQVTAMSAAEFAQSLCEARWGNSEGRTLFSPETGESGQSLLLVGSQATSPNPAPGREIERRQSVTNQPSGGTKRIFIGHGRSLLWRELKDFLASERYEWEEFTEFRLLATRPKSAWSRCWKAAILQSSSTQARTRR